jgi:hypothetical protein
MAVPGVEHVIGGGWMIRGARCESALLDELPADRLSELCLALRCADCERVCDIGGMERRTRHPQSRASLN